MGPPRFTVFPGSSRTFFVMAGSSGIGPPSGIACWDFYWGVKWVYLGFCTFFGLCFGGAIPKQIGPPRTIGYED